MDQGRDAVYVREILERHQLIKKGPETTIAGIYAGPLWYYFLTIGFLAFGGHPMGGIIMLTILNTILAVILFLFVYKYISKTFAWIIAIALQFFWPFFDTSRYAFNPFPTVFLTVLLIIFLVIFLNTKEKKYYFLSLVPVILAFNADLASAAVLYIFFALLGLWFAYKKAISIKSYLLLTFTLPGIASLIVAKQALSVFKNSDQLENAQGIFSGTSFLPTLQNFAKTISDSVFPQSLIVSLLILATTVFLYLKLKKKNSFVNNYAILTALLFVISYFFFSTNKGWKDWHTLFLPVLIFTSILLLLSHIKKHISIPLILLIVSSQLLVFVPRYDQYLKTSDDPSLFANQVKVLDWIYSHNEENGFNAYTYMTNSYFNYPYDYLFWWHGKNKYGHVPCHYEVYPKSHKYVYIPGGEFNYNTPTLGCDRLLFLIKEPIKNIDRYEKWQKNFENTKLIETVEIGKITIEKREYIR